MFTLPFEYNGKKYSAIVHEKLFETGREYRLTIMDGGLESLLFGNHVLVEKAGKICCKKEPNQQNEKLVQQLANSLNEYLFYISVF